MLCVTEMKPDNKGSLVDTDVEIDLELSEEFLRHQQESNKAAHTLGRVSPGESASASLTAGSNPAPLARTPSPAESSVFRSLNESHNVSSGPMDIENATSLGQFNHSALRDSLSHLLSDEPSAQAKDTTVTIKVKLPNGMTKVRRFSHSAKVQELFAFAAIELLQTSHSELRSKSTVDSVLSCVQLSTRAPARTFRVQDVVSIDSPNECKTFADIGMNGASELVFVSLVLNS